MPALRPLRCLLAGSASLLSLMPGLVAPVSGEFGEVVIRRIRICEEVVRGPASRWPGEPPRREVYGRPMPPTNIPFPPQGAEPEELEEGEPG
jgi:hypothetical protein